MKTKAIFINAFMRPNYLRVAMDAMSRCKGFEEWDVFVDFDGGSTADFSVCNSVFQHCRIVRPKNLGPRDHPTEILRAALYFGYEKILYCEEDSLFRTDLLAYVDSQPDQGGFVSCHFNPEKGKTQMPVYISNSPVLLHRPLMRRLIDFMDSKGYIGMRNVLVPGALLDANCPGHDQCWYIWAMETPVWSYFAHRQFALNFGFTGVNWRHFDLEARAFAGPPETWFDSVLKTAKESNFAVTMGTPGFVYA